jgi:Na+-transporting methylmalonyl-CoA/oxaloacetate decarboxylase gamma subunit
MKIFYWVMGVLIVGTFVPSVLSFLIYLITGIDAWAKRARGFWNTSKVLSMFALNLLIWGHVAVGLWQIWRH